MANNGWDAVCGAQVTDLTLAREQQTNFEEYLNQLPEGQHPGIDLTVTVLTTGFWPSYKSSDLALPEEMVRTIPVPCPLRLPCALCVHPHACGAAVWP